MNDWNLSSRLSGLCGILVVIGLLTDPKCRILKYFYLPAFPYRIVLVLVWFPQLIGGCVAQAHGGILSDEPHYILICQRFHSFLPQQLHLLTHFPVRRVQHLFRILLRSRWLAVNWGTCQHFWVLVCKVEIKQQVWVFGGILLLDVMAEVPYLGLRLACKVALLALSYYDLADGPRCTPRQNALRRPHDLLARPFDHQRALQDRSLHQLLQYSQAFRFHLRRPIILS